MYFESRVSRVMKSGAITHTGGSCLPTSPVLPVTALPPPRENPGENSRWANPPEKGKNRKKLRKGEEGAQSKDQTEYSHIHLLLATMDLRKQVEEVAGTQKQVPAKSSAISGTLAASAVLVQSWSVGEHLLNISWLGLHSGHPSLSVGFLVGSVCFEPGECHLSVSTSCVGGAQWTSNPHPHMELTCSNPKLGN